MTNKKPPSKNRNASQAVNPVANEHTETGVSRKVPQAVNGRLKTATRSSAAPGFLIPLVDMTPENAARRIAGHFKAVLIFYKWDPLSGDLTVLFEDGRKMKLSPEKMAPLLKGIP